MNSHWSIRLKERLTDVRLTPRELADLTGLNQIRLTCIIEGEIQPDFEELEKILAVLQVSADWILFGGGVQPATVFTGEDYALLLSLRRLNGHRREQLMQVLSPPAVEGTPAERIFKKFGGARKLAKAIGKDPTAIYRWSYPREKGGTGGYVPSSAIEDVRRAAARLGISLTADDFV